MVDVGTTCSIRYICNYRERNFTNVYRRFNEVATNGATQATDRLATAFGVLIGGQWTVWSNLNKLVYPAFHNDIL